MKYLVFCGLFLASACACAKLIVIEPDDFSEGVDISSFSPHVTLTTGAGNPVFSSAVDGEYAQAAGGNDTHILGERVFSATANYNSEWFYWPTLNDRESALVINFSQPVDYFSLIFADLFADAGGCCSGDPVRVELFDSGNNLLDSVYGDGRTDTYLGEFNGSSAWPVYEFSSELDQVSKVIVGGESEPVSIDRLSFEVPHTVPETTSLSLLLAGLLVTLRPRQRAKHF